MAKPDIKDADSGLGDITSILSNAGVSDLRWLNVDPEEYRRYEALPKQNLDMIPELSRALAWDGKDERIPQLVPLRPHTVVNSNPLEERSVPVRSRASVAHRVAAYVMAGLKDEDIASRVRLEFSPAQVAAEGQDALDVARERGLIGNVYINSSHFPRCAQDGPHRAFVAKHSPRSLYVVAKSDCSGCVHNKGGRCSSFKKEIVSQVRYDGRTLAHYLPVLAAEGRQVNVTPESMSTEEGRKEALRQAFLSPAVPFRDGGPMTVRHYAKPAPVQITEQDVAAYAARAAARSSADPMPSPNVLTVSKRMMEGSVDPVALAASLDEGVRKLRSDHGILGSTWIDADALGGPAEALKFIRSRGADPDFVLMRSASNPSDPALMELGSICPVLPSKPAIGRGHFERACRRAAAEGRMTREMAESAIKNAPEKSDWARLTSQANLFVSSPEPRRVDVSAPYTGRAHHMGHTMDERAPVRQVDPEEIRKSITHMMNIGFSGQKLQEAVLSRYTREELAQVPDVGAQLAAADGVCGSYYVDPTAYPDYGRGCSIGSKDFRKRGAPNLLAASGCTGCRLQTHPGWCSKYAKTLVRSVPEDVRVAAASRRRLTVLPTSPVENPVERYELASEMTLDVGPSPKASLLEVSMDMPSVTD